MNISIISPPKVIPRSKKTDKLKAIVFSGPGEVGVDEFKRGELGDEDIAVRTLYSMVSPGTELRNWAGIGSKFPAIPGYSSVGEVIEVGEKVKGYRIGDRVSGRSCPRFIPDINAAYGGHVSDQIYPGTGEDRPVLLPPGSNPLDYVIAEIGSICWRGVAAAAPQPGETAVVIGQGLIGALSAAWLQAHGCRVIVTDFAQKRLDRALRRGIVAAVHGDAPDAEERIMALTNNGADIVVESSGSSAGAFLAHRLIRARPEPCKGGLYYRGEPIARHAAAWSRLVMQGTYVEKISLNPGRWFPGEGVVVITPQDRGIEDRQNVVDAIWKGHIKTEQFIDKILPPAQAVAAYRGLRDDKENNFSVVFDWTLD
jgi:bacteriochlorophyllide a dehydrogenase